jgi:hypothetical protein
MKFGHPDNDKRSTDHVPVCVNPDDASHVPEVNDADACPERKPIAQKRISIDFKYLFIEFLLNWWIRQWIIFFKQTYNKI